MSQEIHELSREPFEISQLIWKCLQQEITVEEKEVLDEWVGRSEANRQWFEELTGKNTMQGRLSSYHAIAEGREQVWQKILQSEKKPAKTERLRWMMLAAAASVILALSLVVFNWTNLKEKEQAVVHTPDKNEISAPSSNKAILSLDDGRKIYLDSVSNGVLVSQDNVNIEKLADGQLAYRQGAGAQAMVYNTLSNPRGSKVIDITLSDGSRVWLNNESSIRFPLAFGSEERKVVITGEAYFEVAKDARKPFIVEAGEMEVEVLGTQFNVNSYSEEPVIRTTLLEGKVRLKKNDQSIDLEVGQQAQVGNSDIKIIDRADIAQVMAWRNGLISLGGGDIKSIFHQIGRWYDVDIEYQGEIRDLKMFGEIPSMTSLSTLINALELNSGLQIEITGRKIIVKP